MISLKANNGVDTIELNQALGNAYRIAGFNGIRFPGADDLGLTINAWDKTAARTLDTDNAKRTGVSFHMKVGKVEFDLQDPSLGFIYATKPADIEEALKHVTLGTYTTEPENTNG